jgi:hypothetical protein
VGRVPPGVGNEQGKKSVKDVAFAADWSDTSALITCCQQAQPGDAVRGVSHPKKSPSEHKMADIRAVLTHRLTHPIQDKTKPTAMSVGQ